MTKLWPQQEIQSVTGSARATFTAVRVRADDRYLEAGSLSLLQPKKPARRPLMIGHLMLAARAFRILSGPKAPQEWRHTHPGFSEALKTGKSAADGDIPVLPGDRLQLRFRASRKSGAESGPWQRWRARPRSASARNLPKTGCESQESQVEITLHGAPMTHPTMPAKPETAQLESAGEAADLRADVKRRAVADAVRRYRVRKRAGRLLVTVEVDYAILELLAYGTQADLGVLRADKAALSKAAERALRHFARRFRETGCIPH
jgi:hypothetical protein